MKTTNRILLAATATAAFTLVGSAQAQYRIESADGITASPKLRQMLSEQQTRAVVSPPEMVVSSPVYNPAEGVTASPKLQQLLDEQKQVRVAPDTEGVASYQVTSDDGIAASPKVRAQMDERQQQFQIAPLK